MEQLHFRMHCDKVSTIAYQYSPTYKPEEVQLTVVSAAKPEDQVFASSSPGGEFKSMIINEAAKGFFKPGKRYDIFVKEVEEDNGL
jgi:hypothetical protein